MANTFDISVKFKAIDQLTAPIRRMERNVGRGAMKMERSLKALTRAAGGFTRSLKTAGRTAVRFGVLGLGVLGTALVWVTKQFGKIEDATASFTPMLGAKQAIKTVEELNQLAVKTPFKFEHLAGASRILLSMQAATAENLVPTLRMLGDVAGGNADRLNRISLVYGQVLSAGKANSRDMLQFIDAGVPIKAMLADLLKTDIKGITDLTKKGQISAEMVKKSLKAATSIVGGKKGMFFDAMKLMSLTTTGLMAQLTNNVELAGAAIGGAISEPLKEILVKANLLAQEFRKWAQQEENIKKIRKHFDNFKDALWATGIFIRDNWKWMLKLAAAIAAVVVVTKAFAAVLAIINFAMMIGPIGKVVLIIYALIAAVAALWVWWDQIYEFNPVLANSLRGIVAVLAAVVTAYTAVRTVMVAVTAAKLAYAAAVSVAAGAMKVMTAAFWASAVAILANPIFWIPAAIAAVIAAIIALVVYWDEFIALFTDTTWGKAITNAFYNAFIRPIELVVEGLTKIAEWLGIIDSAEIKIAQSNGQKNKDGETLDGSVGLSDVPAIVSPQARNSEEVLTKINESKSTVAVDINNNSTNPVEVTRTGQSNGMTLGATGGF